MLWEGLVQSTLVQEEPAEPEPEVSSPASEADPEEQHGQATQLKKYCATKAA